MALAISLKSESCDDYLLVFEGEPYLTYVITAIDELGEHNAYLHIEKVASTDQSKVSYYKDEIVDYLEACREDYYANGEENNA